MKSGFSCVCTCVCVWNWAWTRVLHLSSKRRDNHSCVALHPVQFNTHICSIFAAGLRVCESVLLCICALYCMFTCVYDINLRYFNIHVHVCRCVCRCVFVCACMRDRRLLSLCVCCDFCVCVTDWREHRWRMMNIWISLHTLHVDMTTVLKHIW